MRLVPAAVAIFLLLTFLAFNQAMISNRANKTVSDLSNTLADKELTSANVSVDSDQRAAHSYFLPPRIFSNRYLTNKQPIDGIQPNQNIQTSANISAVNSNALIRPNTQDLLRLGYLGDDKSCYSTEFGAARSQ